MQTQTKESQMKLTPEAVRALLVEGNERFVQNRRADRDWSEQVATTSKGQFPFAVILSCIDSRAPAELIFDQGIGDVFNVRVAGNVVNEDVLGSMEYACKVAGAKLLLVMGHTRCGAVTAACQRVELGNVTHLLAKIKPAVDHFSNDDDEMDAETIEKVTAKNVALAIEQIRAKSAILSEMENDKTIEIAGAIYDVSTGRVRFL